MSNVPGDGKYDFEVAARTALLGMLAGYLVGPRLHMDPALAGSLGTLAGALIDGAFFWLKGLRKK